MELSSAPAPPPGPDDHVRGRGPLAVVVYGDYECPYCARADRRLRAAPVAAAFRHFAVRSRHPRAPALAAAAEAAALQGRFWEMHESLFDDQGHLDDPHLWERARKIGLDLERFERDRRSATVLGRVERDLRSGIRAGVVSTPSFVVEGALVTELPEDLAAERR